MSQINVLLMRSVAMTPIIALTCLKKTGHRCYPCSSRICPRSHAYLLNNEPETTLQYPPSSRLSDLPRSFRSPTDESCKAMCQHLGYLAS